MSFLPSLATEGHGERRIGVALRSLRMIADPSVAPWGGPGFCRGRSEATLSCRAQKRIVEAAVEPKRCQSQNWPSREGLVRQALQQVLQGEEARAPPSSSVPVPN